MKRCWTSLAATAGILIGFGAPLSAVASPSGMYLQDQPAASRVLGTVTALSSTSISVKPDSGEAVTVSIGSGTRVLRLEPGQTKLSQATPIQISDVNIGDRVLVAYQTADGGPTARIVVAMKKADIAQRQQAEEADWQRRGVGGLVKSVDPAAGTIVLSSSARTITVKTSPSTSVRRYAPDSVAFQDAQPSSVAEIHPGDELQAKGDHSADGSEVTADAIVYGSFRNVAGLVTAVDPSAQTITIQDLATKKPVTLHVAGNSQLHKLDPQMAQMVAMRLRSSSGAGHQGPGAPPSSGGAPRPDQGSGQGSEQEHGGGGANFARLIQRSPAIQLTDLHKGEAVMVVATQGTAATPGNAITLLAGVEPMLQASASASQSMLSSSWSLGGGAGAAGGDAGSQQ